MNGLGQGYKSQNLIKLKLILCGMRFFGRDRRVKRWKRWSVSGVRIHADKSIFTRTPARANTHTRARAHTHTNTMTLREYGEGPRRGACHYLFNYSARLRMFMYVCVQMCRLSGMRCSCTEEAVHRAACHAVALMPARCEGAAASSSTTQRRFFQTTHIVHEPARKSSWCNAFEHKSLFFLGGW